ncbi:MAG: hypothetical protein AAB633_00260 [Patescibacteria group bacterium]
MNTRETRATARAAAMKEIMAWHQEFMRHRGGRDGRPDVQEDGVEFYQVGRNASHNFFVGVDMEGRKFVRTVGGGGCDEDADGRLVWYEDKESVYEVVGFDGHYLGHY